jgi:hypothetical protein
MLQLAIMAAGILLAQTPSPKDSLSTGAQPFGLKGDVLGETLQEFRAKNDRVIALSVLGRDRLAIDPSLAKTKHLPQCTGDATSKGASVPHDVEDLTADEERAGVIKCIAALSVNDDLDFSDEPTVAGLAAYRTVYSFFHERLYKIESELPAESYQTLRDAFAAKYGKPLVTMSQYQNSFGAKKNGEQLLWKTAVSQIRIGQYDSRQWSALDIQMDDIKTSIQCTKVDAAAALLGSEAERRAEVYGQTIKMIHKANTATQLRNNVLVTIWHTALSEQCEAAGAVKDRAKDL